MVKKVLLVVLVLIVACLGYIATRPSTFRIERTATTSAPADVVYAQIADFHRWPQWSPWEDLDPAMTRTIEGSGTGSTYHWVGNDKVGEGRMTITDATPAERVQIKLEFLKPWTATNTTVFALAPDANNTRITWTMEGNNNFMAKTMDVFMNMDKMIGTDFEKGLTKLAAVSESEAAASGTASADTTGSVADTSVAAPRL